jgi:uncharacterized protein (DUF433 family)
MFIDFRFVNVRYLGFTYTQYTNCIPTDKGTRISVELILALLSSGWTEQQILESYPSLTQDTLRAVFGFSERHAAGR